MWRLTCGWIYARFYSGEVGALPIEGAHQLAVVQEHVVDVEVAVCGDGPSVVLRHITFEPTELVCDEGQWEMLDARDIVTLSVKVAV